MSLIFGAAEERVFDGLAQSVLLKLITALLADKPRDPVPYIYGYLCELQKGSKNPVPMSDTEVNKVKNLLKRVTLLREQLHTLDEELSDAEGSSEKSSCEDNYNDNDEEEMRREERDQVKPMREEESKQE
jgi:hypothetical protein